MAERRPLTARDIKSNVEGYQEMSDGGLRPAASGLGSRGAGRTRRAARLAARRVHGRGAVHPPLGALLPARGSKAGRRRGSPALQTCFYLLEGRFAYADRCGFALQNLRARALRPATWRRRPAGTAGRVEVRDPDYSPELQGRLGKLEGAISKQRTVKFRYWSIYKDTGRGASASTPCVPPPRERLLVRDRLLDLEPQGHPHLPGGADPLGHSLCDAARATIRLPAEFDVENYRGRAEWQFGDVVGEARASRG